jgi:3-oxoacyl-[acyl-carrier protein] reductase
MGRGGSIVLVSSISAYSPPFPIAAYGVSKTALLGLVKGLAGELGPSGIRVNGLVRPKGAAEGRPWAGRLGGALCVV